MTNARRKGKLPPQTETKVVSLTCGNIPDNGNDAWVLLRLNKPWYSRERVKVTVERLPRRKGKS
jgi:hypothetical protein